ncbi:AraC family transcriptional regulator [Leptospira kemamanensis]|uniref:AraC family transcriptional regulator n=1 Tax=Leptospira kemamanensis TaxID=2484942 RepID=A0A4R9JSV8_9LEPT|nr:helix-turn-helix domain-containing protein [Leptospira kemamanensis]TGL55802.1 AraC family transcriptional regulator [Leptospira kemamanensis]
MDILFLKPPSEFESFVKEFWIWREVNANELPWIIPSYECEMVFHFGEPPIVETESGERFRLPKSHLVGPQTRRWRVLSESPLHLVSIRFYVAGLYTLFSKQGSVLKNQFPEMPTNERLVSILQNSNGEKTSVVEEKIVEALTEYLRSYPGKSTDIPAYLRFALLELTNPKTSINPLAKKLGITRKQLERKFQEVVGLNPSEYRSVHRVLSLVRNPEHYQTTNPNLRLTDLAHNFEYTDQSHFSNDFKRNSGSIPKDWFAEYEKMSHFYKHGPGEE